MDNFYKIISSKLKSLRSERGWSLSKASDETGVSKAMLGQIERCESSPTIAILWKIASGFNVSFSTFLGEVYLPEYEKVTHCQPKQIHRDDDKIKVATIFPYDRKLGFELFKLDLLPNCEHVSLPHQKGIIEHVIVIDGAMEVLINKEWIPLATNESIRFDASYEHGYRNMTKSKASFHNMIHYSKENEKS